MKIIYRSKKNIIFQGSDFVKDLNVIIRREKLVSKRAVLITGIKSFIETKYFNELKDIFAKNNIVVINHFKIRPNPRESIVSKMLLQMNSTADYVFMVGGGSVIDSGKLLKYFFNKPLKLIALYTLPGSSSIITPFSIYNNKEFKIGIMDKSLIPKISYVNTEIIEKIDINKKVTGIADIFAHSVESLYSLVSNKTSRFSAQKSLSLIINKKFLEISANDLIKADLCAGLSERTSSVLFPHAAGHYLTYKFGITHGISTIYFLSGYLNLLRKKGVAVDFNYIKYANRLYKFFKENDLMPKISLSNKEIFELLNLTNKYMEFVYKNAPIGIDRDDYISLLKNI